MFDSIDLSSFDDMGSHDSMGIDDGFTSGSEFTHTDDFTGMDDTFFGTETTTKGEASSLFPSVNTHDSAPWNLDENFPRDDFNQNESHEVSPKPIDTSELENEISFKGSGYSQSEINSHISEAKHEIADAESDIRHHTSIANSKARMGEPHSFEDSQIRNAQSRLSDAKSDLSKWQHMKPSK